MSFQSSEILTQNRGWTTVNQYSGEEQLIHGLEPASSYAVRVVLIDEMGAGYNGTDVQYAVCNTTCNCKLKHLTNLRINERILCDDV